MRPTSVRSHIKRWLLLTPVVAQWGCGPKFPPCTPDTQLVTTEEARGSLASKTRFLDGGEPSPDGGGLFPDGGSLPDAITAENCSVFCLEVSPFGFVSCTAVPGDGGEMIAACTERHFCGGRRPAGMASRGGAGAGGEFGRYLAGAACLEAASVPAFVRLGRELRAHGAPTRLIRAAARAAHDEVRHARVMARLAREAGAQPVMPLVAPVGERSLEEVLVENRVEGCIRETFGAAIGARQALHARTPRMRKIMAAIARDEIAHAELSWGIARWGEPRLSRAARRRLQASAKLAVATLERELQDVANDEVRDALGLPDAPVALQLFRQVRRDLWEA